MIKESYFSADGEYGQTVFTLFGKGDAAFEKTAAPTLLPEVARYIESLNPVADSQYVLVNALGAGEYYSSNINGDHFPEAALIHAPDDWTGNPLIDKIKSKNWSYGYPTFYSAHPYAHHKNKDSTRAFGEVELSAWNPHMKRVELVVRVDRDKCHQFGGVGTWDKLHAGDHPAVSMGCKVPYDTCSICLDWDAYRKAQATFDPKKHRNPGDAVLAVHKALIAKNGHGIRGVSITRKDYCEHTKKSMNKILPDGRKVFVYNDYPKFFDISFVFIGADKTAKVMMKIAGAGRLWDTPDEPQETSQAEGGEKTAADSHGFAHWEEKTASDPVHKKTEFQDSVIGKMTAVPMEQFKASLEKKASEDAFKLAFLGKNAKDKKGEIIKDVVPNQLAGKAVPLLTKNEPELPKAMLDLLGTRPFEEALSTPTSLGIILRPREFQRIVLIQIGKRDLADEYDRRGIVFPKSDERDSFSLTSDSASPSLARLLLPFLLMRSMLGPMIESRVLSIRSDAKEASAKSSSLSTTLLRKISSAYNGYRDNVISLVTSQELLPQMVGGIKLASVPVDEMFTPLSAAYMKLAFMDEVGVVGADTNVERGLPLRNTFNQHHFGG